MDLELNADLMGPYGSPNIRTERKRSSIMDSIQSPVPFIQKCDQEGLVRQPMQQPQ